MLFIFQKAVRLKKLFQFYWIVSRSMHLFKHISGVPESENAFPCLGDDNRIAGLETFTTNIYHFTLCKATEDNKNAVLQAIVA